MFVWFSSTSLFVSSYLDNSKRSFHEKKTLLCFSELMTYLKIPRDVRAQFHGSKYLQSVQFNPVLCEFVTLGDTQWWKVTKNIYSRIVFKFNFEVFVVYLNISLFCSFILHSTAFQRQILYFLLHYIYLIT